MSSVRLRVWQVWNKPASSPLGESTSKRLLPLLAAARALGMLIVHAPSEAPESSLIKVLPGELLITGVDGKPGSPSRCDAPILNSSRGIRHVLMAGYDTNKCVIDKPCMSQGTPTLVFCAPHLKHQRSRSVCGRRLGRAF